MTTYRTTTGLTIDLRKMHHDDSTALREDHPNPNTPEAMAATDEMVTFYHRSFGKLILKKGQ